MLEGEADNQPQPGSRLSNTNRLLVEMLAAGSTVSLESICQRFQWLPHTGRSAIARLRKHGFLIKACKLNGQAAYRLYAQDTRRHAEGLWTGITEKVALFYQRRAAVLALAA